MSVAWESTDSQIADTASSWCNLCTGYVGYEQSLLTIKKLSHLEFDAKDAECSKHSRYLNDRGKFVGGCSSHVNKIRTAIRNQENMPPIVTYWSKYEERYIVWDGNHRVAAAILEKKTHVPAIICMRANQETRNPSLIKNPKLPNHLRTVESALDWALNYVGGRFDDNLPNVNNYDELIDYLIKADESEDEDESNAESVYAAEKALQYAEEYVGRMLKYEQQDEVVLYRALTVASADEIRWDEVGIYWAYDSRCAGAHWGNGSWETVLTGCVRPEHIDWNGGFLAYLEFGEDECEVRVDKGAPILITAINNEELEEPIHATA